MRSICSIHQDWNPKCRTCRVTDGANVERMRTLVLRRRRLDTILKKLDEQYWLLDDLQPYSGAVLSRHDLQWKGKNVPEEAIAAFKREMRWTQQAQDDIDQAKRKTHQITSRAVSRRRTLDEKIDKLLEEWF